MRKISFLFLLVSIVLLGFTFRVSAEQTDKSVSECLQNPESCEENSDQGENGENIRNQSTEGVSFQAVDFIKMIFATIFVLALLYLLLKYMNKKSNGYKQSQLVKNLGGTALGGNRSVQIIKVGKRILIVGVGENIELLKEIDDEAEQQDIITQYNEKMEYLTQPGDIISKILRRKKANKKQISFRSMLDKQFNDMKKERQKLYKEVGKDQNHE
ncbi:flagellar biosynthetic protein FliO [Bacillaceae bacterium Marseille-Q3522]|nr:flagellar biosynthetic protein FliO [Bacillaceae bacterium Marseille-Q3522]